MGQPWMTRGRPQRTWSAGLLLLILAGCTGPYDDLATDFTAVGDPTGVQIKGDRVVMSSRKHRGAYTFGSVRVFLTDAAVEIGPTTVARPLLANLRLPAASVSGCSMTCFGGHDRRASLVFEQKGAAVSFDAASEIVEWCWQNGVPMLSGAAKRGWLYQGLPLPSRAGYVRPSREDYARQAERACMGY
jgi:hypothetical protein